MILDSSAVVAIALKEPGFEKFLDRLRESPGAGIGAPTLTETVIVLSARLGKDARGVVESFLEEGSITVLPFAQRHFEAAADAWLRYGKGRHPAALNLGDCFSYAMAKVAGEPLLCAGEDFARTDLELA